MTSLTLTASLIPTGGRTRLTVDEYRLSADSAFITSNVLFVRRSGHTEQVAFWDQKALAWIGNGPLAGATFTYINIETETT